MNREAELLLVDARAQIRAALAAAVGDRAAVRQSWPREPVDGAVVTCGEYSNCATECPVVDEIAYQVDIWAPDRELLADLTAAVCRAMGEIGLRRQYMGPETPDGGRHERRTMRFGRRVDKRWMRLVD